MILLIDNYDSFTFNLVQSIRLTGANVKVERNDQIAAAEVIALNPDAIIFSPGPGRPEAAGNMPSILDQCIGKFPMLGVCLGHQMMGLHFGAEVVNAAKLVHGKSSEIFHDGQTIFENLPSPFEAGRYHSLSLRESSLPAELEISARAEDGEIMGIRHRELRLEGVQFHPESILTPVGQQLLDNFVQQFTPQKTMEI